MGSNEFKLLENRLNYLHNTQRFTWVSSIIMWLAVTMICVTISVNHCDERHPVVEKPAAALKPGDLVRHKIDGWDGIVLSRNGDAVQVRIDCQQVRAWNRRTRPEISPIHSGVAFEWKRSK